MRFVLYRHRNVANGRCHDIASECDDFVDGDLRRQWHHGASERGAWEVVGAHGRGHE